MTEPAPPSAPAGSSGWGSQALAGMLTVVGVVLLGAPAGLLWAAVAPPVDVVVAASGAVSLARPDDDGFIAVDGFFLGVVLLAGLICGVVAWLLSGRGGHRYGPGVVVGLAVGGLLAAEVARRTGELVDAGAAQAVVDAGREGVVSLSVRLRAESARAGWPVAALAAHMVLTVSAHRAQRGRVSSG